MEQTDELPIESDYIIKGFHHRFSEIFVDCFYSKAQDKAFLQSNTKVNKLFQLITSLDSLEKNSQEVSSSQVATGILEIVNAKDFNRDFYKLYALSTLYIINPEGLRSFIENTQAIITIEVTTEPAVYLNGEKIEIRNITKAIQAIKENLTPEENENLLAKLVSEKEVKMGLIVDIKLQLREAEVKRLHFSTRETIQINK